MIVNKFCFELDKIFGFLCSICYLKGLYNLNINGFMSGFELNKIAASVLVAGLIAMVVGIVSNALYKPELKPGKRGFSVAVTEDKHASAEAAPEVKVDVAELMKKANADAGKDIIKKCMACHSLEKGGPNRVGPHLWDVVGNDKGKADGYKYSAALVAVGGKWDEESLFHFLHKPSKFIPGTKMTFVGLSKPEEIANVIAYLKTAVHD
jgi:cytochrome c